MTGLSPRQVSYETWLSHLASNEVLRFKDVFEIRKRPNNSSFPQVLSLTNKGIIERDISNNEGQLAESYDNYQVVEIGDFVLNPMDLLSGWVARSSFEGVISNAYFVFRLRSGSTAISSNPVFYELLLQSYYTNGILEPFGKGVGRPENGGGRWTLNSETLSTIPFPNLPLVQQDAIVGFLDNELAKVDKLIEMQRSLISLASEHVEVNILHKVTGQDSLSARVHSPNLAWSPDLPEGWKSTTIRHFAQVFAGGTPDRSNPAFWEDGQIPWINSGSVNQGRITTPSAFITEAAVRGSSTRLAPKGALVIALAGQGATKGTPALMEIDAFCNQSMAAIVCDSRVDARYLYFWLRANYLNIRSLGGGDLRDGLNLEHIKSISCPIPPKKVQVKIAEELEGAVLQGNRLREQLELTIAKLLERKAAVISAAVTGKLEI